MWQCQDQLYMFRYVIFYVWFTICMNIVPYMFCEMDSIIPDVFDEMYKGTIIQFGEMCYSSWVLLNVWA